jgi:hypothetical protein
MFFAIDATDLPFASRIESLDRDASEGLMSVIEAAEWRRFA